MFDTRELNVTETHRTWRDYDVHVFWSHLLTNSHTRQYNANTMCVRQFNSHIHSWTWTFSREYDVNERRTVCGHFDDFRSLMKQICLCSFCNRTHCTLFAWPFRIFFFCISFDICIFTIISGRVSERKIQHYFHYITRITYKCL